MRSYIIGGCAFLLLSMSVGCRSQKQVKDDLLRQGANSYVAGDFNAAAEAKKKLVDMDPTNMTAQFDLAMTLKQANRNPEAITVFNKVVASKKEPYASLSAKMIGYLNAKQQPK